MEVQIATKDKELEIQEWMDQDLQDLLKSTLNKDPLKRPTVEELKSHKWFQI